MFRIVRWFPVPDVSESESRVEQLTSWKRPYASMSQRNVVVCKTWKIDLFRESTMVFGSMRYDANGWMDGWIDGWMDDDGWMDGKR